MLHLAQSIQDPYFFSLAHARLGFTLYMLGEFTSARAHLEQGIALYDPHMHPHISLGLTNPRLDCLFYVSMALWHLGYPDKALQRSHEAVALGVIPVYVDLLRRLYRANTSSKVSL